MRSHRFESNVRSTVVGIVGAGGIGFLLNEHFRTYEYDTCSTIMLLITSHGGWPSTSDPPASAGLASGGNG
jgi:hypothetical protein